MNIQKEIKALIKAERRANVGALNDTAKIAREDMIEGVVESYNLKRSRFRKAIKIEKAKTSYPFAYLVVANAAPPLADFSGARERRGGVSVEIERGKRVLIRGAFIEKSLDSGRREVMLRIKGEAKKKQQRGRYAGTDTLRQPIRIAYGPSYRVILDRLDHLVPDSVARNFERLHAVRLERELNKLSR